MGNWLDGESDFKQLAQYIFEEMEYDKANRRRDK